VGSAGSEFCAVAARRAGRAPVSVGQVVTIGLSPVLAGVLAVIAAKDPRERPAERRALSYGSMPPVRSLGKPARLPPAVLFGTFAPDNPGFDRVRSLHQSQNTVGPKAKMRTQRGIGDPVLPR
jgi:hypothetical protein